MAAKPTNLTTKTWRNALRSSALVPSILGSFFWMKDMTKHLNLRTNAKAAIAAVIRSIQVESRPTLNERHESITTQPFGFDCGNDQPGYSLGGSGNSIRRGPPLVAGAA